MALRLRLRQQMKNFRDSAGTEWTVFEVRRGGTASSDWSYLPSGFSDGWLCFECSTAKKRLVRYPEQWREFGQEKLLQLLAQAQPAPRTTLGLADDLGGDVTGSQDAQAK